MLAHQMLATWRRSGVDASKLELWAVGYAGSESLIRVFAAGADAACFTDSNMPGGANAWTAFQAVKDDLFIIGRQGLIQHRIFTGTDPVSDPVNRMRVEGWVRALLPP